MPEIYDQREAQKLADDASAIVGEAAYEDGLLTRLLFEAELAGARAARDALAQAIEERQNYHKTISGLWAFLAEGAREADMAKVRGAYSGLRTASMNEMARDPIGKTLNQEFKEKT